jgi:hypothetical protein
MSNEPISSESLQKARQEIHGLVRKIEELSKQDLEVEDYFQQFLSAVVTALAAAGGAVWKRGEAGEIELVCQINLRTTEIAEGGEDEQRHGRLLMQTMTKGESIVIPPYAGNNEAGNPTRFMLMFVPLCSDDAIEGVIEIFQRPGASIDVQRG